MNLGKEICNVADRGLIKIFCDELRKKRVSENSYSRLIWRKWGNQALRDSITAVDMGGGGLGGTGDVSWGSGVSRVHVVSMYQIEHKIAPVPAP